jgi:protease-4
MSLEADAVVDRRRLSRRLSFWRVAAIGVAVLAAIGLAVQAGSPSSGIAARKQIARVEISGVITDNRDQTKLLKRLAKASHVEAVLLSVNSPGGTTTGGEALFEAIREVAEKKPVVAVMGTMATSAAYICSLASDHIVARGNTVTGSVGVIFQWVEVSQLMDKLGVKMNEVKSGNLKAVPSPFQPLDDTGRKLTAEMVEESQRWFVSLVSSRRKLDPAAVPGLLQGRIFSGRQALEHKLVDAIGGEREAIKWLESERRVAANLSVVDWKPKSESSWGLSGSVAGFAGWLWGAAAEDLAQRLLGNGAVGRLRLDGLVSVWHAAN